MKTDQDIRRSIEEKRQDYIDAALFIWDHPENIFEEYRSSACLAELLKRTVSGSERKPQAWIRPLWRSGEAAGRLSDIWGI